MRSGLGGGRDTEVLWLLDRSWCICSAGTRGQEDVDPPGGRDPQAHLLPAPPAPPDPGSALGFPGSSPVR